MTNFPEDERKALIPGVNAIDIQMSQKWQFITPAIYRYEDQRWIDHFFETGTLRLSTFNKFSMYEDEVRGDQNEGSAICHGETKTGGTVVAVIKNDPSIFVLCGTHRLEKSMRDKFERNSAFQITNTLLFSAEISRQLIGFKGGFEGSCIYRPTRKIERYLDLDHKQLSGMDQLSAISSAFSGPEMLLLKGKKHENQAEYRFVWEVDTFEGDYIDVVVPLARQHCRKVEDDEYDG